MGIWLYIFLLLFEGALRKWFLPFLAGPLAIVRDPLALVLLFFALKDGILKANIYLASMIVLCTIAIFTTLWFGHGNLFVTLFGARVFLIQFPLIFVIGALFKIEDVIKIGKFFIYVSIPMTVLMALQFYSPQSAWVNLGIGGDEEGAGFSGALGFFRPPGTFSFISGLVQFYGVTTCFILYFWFKTNEVNKIILILSTLCLFAAIPFSISRTLFYQVAISLIFAGFVVSRDSRNIPKVIGGTIAAIGCFVLLSSLSIIKTPLEAFTARFEGATKYEGGVSGSLIDRYLGGMINAVTNSSKVPDFGFGLGILTNAGKNILGMNEMVIYAEDEWIRLIGESGLVLGFFIILIRVIFSIELLFKSYKHLKTDNILPWLLISFGLTIFPNGQWAQPTTLGFSILIAGLVIASFNKTESKSGV